MPIASDKQGVSVSACNAHNGCTIQPSIRQAKGTEYLVWRIGTETQLPALVRTPSKALAIRAHTDDMCAAAAQLDDPNPSQTLHNFGFQKP